MEPEQRRESERDVALSCSGTTAVAPRAAQHIVHPLHSLCSGRTSHFCILPLSLCILHTHPISALSAHTTSTSTFLILASHPISVSLSPVHIPLTPCPPPRPAPPPRASHSCFSSPTRCISHDAAGAGFVHCALCVASKEGDKRKKGIDHTDRRGRDWVGRIITSTSHKLQLGSPRPLHASHTSSLCSILSTR